MDRTATAAHVIASHEVGSSAQQYNSCCSVPSCIAGVGDRTETRKDEDTHLSGYVMLLVPQQPGLTFPATLF